MRLVRIGRAVWDLVAIADEAGRSLWEELAEADSSDGGAEQMRAALRETIPRDGPPRGKSRCRSLGDDIWEFKEWGVRVLWFYDAGEPVTRRRIVATHTCLKMPKKKFQQEKARAVRFRTAYLEAKRDRRLQGPEEDKPQ